MKTIVKYLLVVVLFAAVNLCYSMADAQTYPTKPVRIIVSFAAGGAADIFARVVAAQLSERLGQQVFVENHAGAGGVIGSEMAAKSKPDGYTLVNVASAFAISASLDNLPFDPVKDFIPLAKLGGWPYVLVTHPNYRAKSVKELVALAKESPGNVTFGAAGVGSFVHLATELFKMQAGIDIMIVQFKGAGPAMIDLLGGHTNAHIGGITQCLPHIKSGKLKALGVTGSNRSPVLPDVPTIAEAGVPSYESSNWWGLAAPAGTPKAIVDRLDRELSIIVNSEKTRKLFVEQGGDVAYLGPVEFRPFLGEEFKKWARVIKEGKIKLE